MTIDRILRLDRHIERLYEKAERAILEIEQIQHDCEHEFEPLRDDFKQCKHCGNVTYEG